MQVHDPKNDKKIEDLYVVLSEDDKGMNGIVAFSKGGKSYPLVVSDIQLLEKMKPTIVSLKQWTNKKMALYRFSNREKLEEF